MLRPSRCTLIAIVASLLLAVRAPQIHARGGGGCLEAGTPILTPAGNIPVELLQPGDRVLGLLNGTARPVTVADTTRVRTADIFEITIGGQVLRATAEHLVAAAPGVFRRAAALKAGDPVLIVENGGSVSAAVTAVRRIRARTDAYNLLVDRGGTYLADGVVVHNKGCFLPETRIRRDDGTELPISRVKPGDRLLAFTDDGAVLPATVRSVIAHDVNEYRVVRTERMVLQVTPEHPFSVGGGTFRTLEALRPGDTIQAYDGQAWSDQRILSIETVTARTRVYNLQTDAPHTFFANGIAVHNKGGGGCFPAGTRVRTPAGPAPIETLAEGDVVTAVDERGRQVPARVTATHATLSRLLTVQTKRGLLVTTDEHPLLLSSGEYRDAGMLAAGDRVAFVHNRLPRSAPVTGLSSSDERCVVYNLTVEGPHTFIADGFVAHNKGGGGGGFRSSGGRSSSRGGSGGETAENIFVALWVAGFVVWVVVAIVSKKSRRENLDQLYSRSDIGKKSERTLKLIRFIARQDPSFNEKNLEERTRTTFRKLQECWQARDYGPMRRLLMPDLFADHLRQIEGMKRNHEINMIDGLQLDAIDLINVRYPLNRNEREFTALITATARDYYIDDRTQEKLRGDDGPAQFQEFWTFQFHQDAWFLREIEQTAESDILNDDNYFEQFTDKAVDQVYGEEAGTAGPAGPWAEPGALVKEQRIERLLNHLVRTDKLWARNRMLQTARSTFIAVTGAWESGSFPAGLDGKLFPELARHLTEAIEKNGKTGVTLEFRNLAVRKAGLVLVKNFADNRNDEFVVRILAHAQKVMKRGGLTVRQDDDVTAFEEYLTFGRLDNEWKLKEIVAPEAGRELVELENVDEGSTPQLIAWYYQHKRPV